ncbi:recombinase family protein [Thermodesulfobacteriota bacterium]
MRAVRYIRVSTEEQSKEGISMEMQATKIRAYAELTDMELVGIIEDAGISGKSIKARPGVQEILKMVKDKRVEAVIVYKLDRLARYTIETLEMAKAMDKRKVALHSITEKLDTQSAMGKFFFTLMASMAEMERNAIAERTAAAMAQKRGKGEFCGGQAPYGFRNENGQLVEDPDEQEIIRRIHNLKAKGYSTRKIAKALVEEGITTLKGTARKQTQVVRILSAA